MRFKIDFDLFSIYSLYLLKYCFNEEINSFIMVVVFNSLILMSQSLIVTGDTALIWSVLIHFVLTSHLTVKNISSNNTLRVLCEKSVISQTFLLVGTLFAGEGACYSENLH